MITTHDSNSAVDNPANENNNGGAEMELFHRLQKLQDRIEILGFNHSVLLTLPLSPILSANSTITPSPSLILSAATDLCTKLGLVLLQQHNRQQQYCNNNHRHRQQPNQLHPYHEAIINWYHSLHKSSRTMATNIFRSELRKHAPEFPSTELSSGVVAKALLGGLQLASLPPATSAMAAKSAEALAVPVPSCDSDWGDENVGVNGSQYSEWNIASKSLVELQVLHDALETTTLGHEQRVQLGSPCSTRLDLLDELCRPLAERVRFHFLEERSGGLMSYNIIATSMASPTKEKEDEDNIEQHHQHSHFERLPEWLFQYLREVVQDHGVYSLVIMKGVQPLMDSVMKSLIVRASVVTEASIADEEGRGMDNRACAVLDENIGIHNDSVAPKTTSEHEMIRTLKRKYFNHAPTYFLQEVARMARHVLRAKSFFRHPDIVGSACLDRTVVLRGIEQLFLFDDFLMEKLREYSREKDFYNVDIHDDCMRDDAYFGGGFDFGHSNYLPPKLVDTFMSTDSFLLTWWLEEERDGILQKLHQCASVTLLHAQYDQSEDSDGGHGPQSPYHEASSSDRKQRLYPPISELFIALLNSARWKSNAFSDQKCRQLYTTEVVAPMCSQYLDMVHAEATYLRKRLLVRRSRHNFLSDERMTLNVFEWSSLITGTNLVAQAVLSFHHPMDDGRAIGKVRNKHGNDSREELYLDRVGESMKRLCTAMIDEFTSAFIETIVMERAQLASYMMRAPFMLSEPSLPTTLTDHDSFMKKKQCHKVDRIDEAPSPDLTNSIHVVSVCVMACNMTKLKLRKMSLPSSISSLNESSLLEFGCHSIRDAIKFAIGQKLLDIAIDPQGMTPEISLGGAIQFRHDVMSFGRLFDESGSGIVSAEKRSQTNEPGPMERVETASRLMSLESSQILTLREALRALLVDQNYESTSLFGRGRGVPANDCLDSEQRLIVDDYCNDERIMEEAISMIEAKGFGALSLDEAISLINRRV